MALLLVLAVLAATTILAAHMMLVSETVAKDAKVAAITSELRLQAESAADMGKLFRKINDTVAKMGERLYGGDIAAQPLKGGADACQYCAYGSVCAYRQGEPVNVFSMKADEVYQRLDSEQGGEQ